MIDKREQHTATETAKRGEKSVVCWPYRWIGHQKGRAKALRPPIIGWKSMNDNNFKFHNYNTYIMLLSPFLSLSLFSFLSLSLLLLFFSSNFSSNIVFSCRFALISAWEIIDTLNIYASLELWGSRLGASLKCCNLCVRGLQVRRVVELTLEGWDGFLISWG